MHVIPQENYDTRQEFEKAVWNMFIKDAEEYIRQSETSTQFRIDQNDIFPCLKDVFKPADDLVAGVGYLLFDLTVAKWINRSGVKHVYDIGSRLDGLISHLLAMDIKVTMLDIRPMPYEIEGLDFIQANAMEGLNELEDNSIETLTSLCVFEHFGLGRYGDPVDFDGWKKALEGVKRKIKVGGQFYFEVPVGKRDRVRFNAHRIFRPATIVETLAPTLQLERFECVHNGESKVTPYFFGEGKSFSETLQQIENITDRFIGEEDDGIFVFRKTRMVE